MNPRGKRMNKGGTYMNEERKFGKLKVVAATLLIIAATATATVGVMRYRSEERFGFSDGHLRIYSPKELTYEILAGRAGDLVVERIEGFCFDDSGHGKVFNNGESNCCYISYAGAENVKAGDFVVTYCLYNPENDYEDDIIARYDYVVGHDSAAD